MCWQGRRNYHRTKGDREHTTSGAATNDQGNSRNAQQQETLRSAVAGVPGSRCAEAALARPPRGLALWRHAM
jgi:hypothetical protein